MKFRSIGILLVCLSLLAGAALAVEVETVTVSTSGSANSAPVAENLSLRTYREVSVSGAFQAKRRDEAAGSFCAGFEKTVHKSIRI